ncbi:MAG: BamA/TamA family outer membrane protein [Desulfurivibrio sp.]|nr:BamA/TamA family outer membrane protein [Desulfurivibrio sp.]
MSALKLSSGGASSPPPAPGWRLLPWLWWLALLLAAVGGWPTPAAAAVNFQFHGNTALPESRLRAAAAPELATFSADEAKRRQLAAIDDAAYLMRLAYRHAGYYFAEVDYRLDNDQQVTFLIAEGPLTQVTEIIIDGNHYFSEEELQKIIRQRLREAGTTGATTLLWVEARLREALENIRTRYRENGFPEVAVNAAEPLFGPRQQEAAAIRAALAPPSRDDMPSGPPSWLPVTIKVRLEEGVRQLVSAIRLFPAAAFQPATTIPSTAGQPPPAPVLPLPPPTTPGAGPHPTIAAALAQAHAALLGQPYSTRRKLLLRSLLLEAYQELGYAEARIVVHDRPGPKPGNVELLAEVASGPRLRIGEIAISGNQRTTSDFIQRRLRLESGDILRDSQRRESFRELYRTGLFTRVDIETGDQQAAAPATPTAKPAATDETPRTETRPLLVAVEEGLSREFFLEGGWGSYEMLRAQVGFTDRNLGGRGRTLRLTSGASLKGVDIRAGITDPWLFASRVTADLPIYYRIRQEPSFTRRELGGALLFSRRLPHELTASLGYRLRRSELRQIDADISLESEKRGYNVAAATFRLNRDTRDDIFFPGSGQRVYGAMEIAAKELGSELAFQRFTAGWRHFHSLNRRLVLALRVDSGLLLPGRDQVGIPLGERFYSGGENSVRSFREGKLGPRDLDGQPVGGMAFNLFSIELRHRWRNNLALTLFADYGNLSPNQSRRQEGHTVAASRSELIKATLDDYFSDFRPALGVGMQYLLPVGPVRLDVAFNPDRRSGEEDLVIHFSLGMAF